MGKIFTNTEYTTQTISAAAAVVSLAGVELPIIMTDINFNFSRSMTPIYPVNAVNGEKRIIKVSSAPQGSLHIGSIIAPDAESMADFLEKVAKPCAKPGESVDLHFQPFADECGAAPGDFTLKGVTLRTLSVALQGGGQSVISFGTDYEFIGLDMN